MIPRSSPQDGQHRYAFASYTTLPTPGGLGGVEALMVTLLTSLTMMQPQTAAAVTLAYRLASYWFVIVTGGVAAAYLVYGS